MVEHTQTTTDNGQTGSHGGFYSSRLPGEPALDGIVRACSALTPLLTETLSEFWGVPIRPVFLGASFNTHYFWRMDDFHVSQLLLEKNHHEEAAAQPPAMALLRLSESACSSLLAKVLGVKPHAEFSFRQLSPLEANILNELSRDLLSVFKQNLLKKPSKKARIQPVNLIWVLALEQPAAGLEQVMNRLDALSFLENLELGKLVLTVPVNAVHSAGLPNDAHGEAQAVIPDHFFDHVLAPARIYIGGSRVPLADLDHLEPEDIIVLEDSHVSGMALVDPSSGERLPFQVHLDNAGTITLPYTQEFETMDTQSQSGSPRQKLWDNLMIEVGAELEPIKLPLKQIKQMSEGLVIEMGDLVQNRVSLQVEGKTLAWGELIIVGDKFGVRVNKVVQDDEPTSTSLMPVGQSYEPHESSHQESQMPMPQDTMQEEDANLDNFLNQDFDEEEEEDW